MYILNKRFFKDLFKVGKYADVGNVRTEETWYHFLWFKWGYVSNSHVGYDEIVKIDMCWNRIIPSGSHFYFLVDLFFNWIEIRRGER